MKRLLDDLFAKGNIFSSRGITRMLMVITLIAFACPFLVVSCGTNNVLSLSGYQLTFGAQVFLLNAYQKIPFQILLIITFVCTLLSLVMAALPHKKFSMTWWGIGTIIGISCLLSLLVFLKQTAYNIATGLAVVDLSSLVLIKYSWGLYATFVCFIGSLIFYIRKLFFEAPDIIDGTQTEKFLYDAILRESGIDPLNPTAEIPTNKTEDDSWEPLPRENIGVDVSENIPESNRTPYIAPNENESSLQNNAPANISAPAPAPAPEPTSYMPQPTPQPVAPTTYTTPAAPSVPATSSYAPAPSQQSAPYVSTPAPTPNVAPVAPSVPSVSSVSDAPTATPAPSIAPTSSVPLAPPVTSAPVASTVTPAPEAPSAPVASPAIPSAQESRYQIPPIPTPATTPAITSAPAPTPASPVAAPITTPITTSITEPVDVPEPEPTPTTEPIVSPAAPVETATPSTAPTVVNTIFSSAAPHAPTILSAAPMVINPPADDPEKPIKPQDDSDENVES